MSLPHALLTALVERPCSGTDLASRFDRSIGHFWHATHQQIYRELGRLEEAGWVTSEATEGRGRKRAYQVLPAGREELRRWMLDRHEPKPMRDELMVKLRAEAAIGPTGLREELERQRALHEEKLALYRRIEARDFTGREATRELRLQHLVLKAGIMHESMSVALTSEALDILAAPPGKA